MQLNYKHIIARLELGSKLYDWSSMEDTIIGLVSEAAVASANRDAMLTLGEREKVEVEIENGVGLLPLDCYRFLMATDMKGNEIECETEAMFVKPKHIVTGAINVIYKAVSIDENGLPTFSDQQYDYCYHYTFVSILRDDYMTGKLPDYVWREMNQNLDAAFSKAITQRLTTQKMDRAVQLQKIARYYNRNPKRY